MAFYTAQPSSFYGAAPTSVYSAPRTAAPMSVPVTYGGATYTLNPSYPSSSPFSYPTTIPPPLPPIPLPPEPNTSSTQPPVKAPQKTSTSSTTTKSSSSSSSTDKKASSSGKKEEGEKKGLIIGIVIVMVILIVVIIVVVVVVEKEDDGNDGGDSDDDDGDDDDQIKDPPPPDADDFDSSNYIEDPPVPDFLSFDNTPFIGMPGNFLTRDEVLQSSDGNRSTIRYILRYEEGNYVIYASTPDSTIKEIQFILAPGNYRFLIIGAGRLVIMETSPESTSFFRVVNVHGYAYSITTQSGERIKDEPSDIIEVASESFNFSNTEDLYLDIHVPVATFQEDRYFDDDEYPLYPHKEKILLGNIWVHYYIVKYENIIYILNLTLGRLAGVIPEGKMGTLTLFNRGFFTLSSGTSSQSGTTTIHIVKSTNTKTGYLTDEFFYDPMPVPDPDENGLYNVSTGWITVTRKASSDDVIWNPGSWTSTETIILPETAIDEVTTSNRVGLYVYFYTELT